MGCLCVFVVVSLCLCNVVVFCGDVVFCWLFGAVIVLCLVVSVNSVTMTWFGFERLPLSLR